MGLDKKLSRCLKGHLCNLGIQKPFVVDIPKKHNTIKIYLLQCQFQYLMLPWILFFILNRQIPPIKEEQIPASFRIVLSLNLNICSDTITTAANREKKPSISSACVAFQALVHHGLFIPSSVNEKRGMHQGYIKVVTNIVKSNQSHCLILLT